MQKRFWMKESPRETGNLRQLKKQFQIRWPCGPLAGNACEEGLYLREEADESLFFSHRGAAGGLKRDLVAVSSQKKAGDFKPAELRAPRQERIYR